MAETQNYSNHVRWFPLVHFVLFPVLFINFLCHLVRLIMVPGWERGFWTLLSLVFILMVLAARGQALNVQNRVIRLEERLRYKDLLSADLAQKASNLPLGQIFALRFASDEELPNLLDQVLGGKLTTSKEIKLAIKNWRADYLRV